MGICCSSDNGPSTATINRSNKVRDCSSFATKDNQQSLSLERYPSCISLMVLSLLPDGYVELFKVIHIAMA